MVAGVLDVSGASPRRFFFEVLRHFSADPVEADRLAYFASPDGREALAQYNQREGVQRYSPAMLYFPCTSLPGALWHPAMVLLEEGFAGG